MQLKFEKFDNVYKSTWAFIGSCTFLSNKIGFQHIFNKDSTMNKIAAYLFMYN